MSRSLRPALAAGATFVLGLALAAASAVWQAHHNRAEAAQLFESLAQRATAQLAARLQTYEHGVRGLRGAVVMAGVGSIRRSRFHDYIASRALDREFPGVRGFGVITRVPEAEEAAFVAAARRDGWPDFAILQLEPHARDRYVIEYVEPVETNRAAVGLDIASEVDRRSAAEASARSGEATLTAPITLVQARGPARESFLLLLPIYRPEASVSTPAEREAAVAGWAYAPLILDEMLNGFDWEGEQFTLELRDATGSDVRRFFASPGSEQPAAAGLRRHLVIPVFGRAWSVDLGATGAFMKQLGQIDPLDVGLALAALAALAALLAALALQLSQRNGREKQVRIDETRRAAMVESSADAIIGEGLDGVIIDWNRGAEALFGYPAKYALGRTASELLFPTGLDQEDAEMLAAIARGEPAFARETVRCCQDGALLEVSVIASPILAADGRRIGLSKTIRDVGEARRAQRALAALNADLERQVAQRTALLDTARHDLQSILDAVPSMIGYWDKDLINRVANKAYSAWFAIEPIELREKHLRALLGDKLFELNRPHVEAALRGEPQVFERAIPSPDGSGLRHSLAHYLPDVVGGEVRGFYVLVHDISEVKRAETALRATSSILGTVLSSASEVSIIATDPNLVISVFNTGAERLLGYSSAEVVGRATPLLIHDAGELEARAGELTAALGREIASGEVFSEPSTLGQAREWTYVARDGKRIPVSLVVTAMHDEAGALSGYLGMAHDVSRQKSDERALRAAVHKANQANRAKSQFLANMSHELRTPMNAVIGFSYLLERTPLDPGQSATLRKINLASKTLLSIINNVLDLSKIEAAELEIERAPFSLGDLVDNLSDVMRAQAEMKGIAFTVGVHEGVPPAIVGDATRVHQILANLIANAIKFTERGEVRFDVRLVSAADGEARLRFVVRDSGIGITPEVLPRLFAPFAQADASTTRRFGGTGLGLSIVKELVKLMAGELGVSSIPQVGSEFWVELSFAVSSASAPLLEAAVTPRRGLAGVRVLIADDSAINLEVAQRILELEGAEVVLASNGQEALDYLVGRPQGFDVLLLDIQMPVLDGYETTRRIRGDLGLTRLPIIALTAGTLTSEQRAARDAGMNDFVGKPFDPRALVRRIRKHVPRLDDPGPASEQARPSAPSDGWPAIEGIDAVDASARLGGDTRLLRAMLKRLLGHFGDLGRVSEALDAAALGPLATRLHDLKGSAGTLGATRVAGVAAEAEAACREGHVDRARALTRELGERLDALGRSAAPALEAREPAPPREESGPGAELDPGELRALLKLLMEFDLAAMPRIEALAPELRRLLGNDAWATLREQVDSLDFAEVASKLETLLPCAALAAPGRRPDHRTGMSIHSWQGWK